MHVTPVSGDLMVKLGLGLVVLGGVVFVLYKVKQGVTAAADAVVASVPYVNPADERNLINQGVTAVGAAVVSDTGPGRNADGSWTLGGSVYDLTHKDAVTGKWWWE